MIGVMVIIYKATKVIAKMILMTNGHQDHWLVTLHQGQGPLQSDHCCLDGFPAKENIQSVGEVGLVTNHQIAKWTRSKIKL